MSHLFSTSDLVLESQVPAQDSYSLEPSPAPQRVPVAKSLQLSAADFAHDDEPLTFDDGNVYVPPPVCTPPLSSDSSLPSPIDCETGVDPSVYDDMPDLLDGDSRNCV